MKLYGLASAFLHDTDDNSKLHIHCNPIAMTDGDREHFEVVQDLAYKETVDLGDIAATCRAFTRFVNTWEEVIRRQKSGMERAEDKELPVAFLAGDAAFNKININALFVAFFGQRFSAKDIDNNGVSAEEMSQFMASIQSVSKKIDSLDDAGVQKLLKSDPEAIACARIMDKMGKGSKHSAKALVRRVANARKVYLKQHGEYPQEFIEACGKLPDLLEQSHYHHGRFSNSGEPITGAPPDCIAEIRTLEEPFREGQPEATERLLRIARELGAYYGNEYTYGSKVFKIPGPKNFDKDPKLQARYPELAFFHWQDEQGRMPFKQAFHEAFLEANWHPSYRYMKLPMDGDKPLYTDPVADMMVEIYRVAKGTRAWFTMEQSHDEPIYRNDYDHKALVSQLAEQTYFTALMKKRGSHTEQALSAEADATKVAVRR